jgi:hypothetical protein
MTLQLFVTFAICFMSGGIHFSNYKLSRSTWTWYVIAVLFSIPAFTKVITMAQG